MALGAAVSLVKFQGIGSEDPRCIEPNVKAWFVFVSTTAWINELILIIIYSLNINNAVRFINWQLVELGHCAFWTLLYLIASITELATFYKCDLYIAAGSFGLFMTFIYACSTSMAFLIWQASGGNGQQTPQPQPTIQIVQG